MSPSSQNLLDQLEQATLEHGDVSVAHETGWCLTVLSRGRVIWENIEELGEPMHLNELGRNKILELMTQVAVGDFGAVNAQPWLSGYGS